MFRKRITVFKLFGFTVRLDLSWFFILVLVTWSLAGTFFPQISSPRAIKAILQSPIFSWESPVRSGFFFQL